MTDSRFTTESETFHKSVWKNYCTSLVLCLFSVVTVPQGRASPQQIDVWDPAFDYTGNPNRVPYSYAVPAKYKWRLCVVYPHLKDAYWLGVNYGMVEAAKRLKVEVVLVEASGYPNLERQRKLLTGCSELDGVDAVIFGTVSFDGLTDLTEKIASKMPVLATVNDVADEGIDAKVGVSWYEMGHSVGRYLVNRHPAGSTPTPVAWFPGPEGAGWVPFVDQGFKEAIEGSALNIVTTGWGDTGKSIQRNLVQKALDSHPHVRYLVGNALMAEAAISVLRKRNLEDKTEILSTYFTPGVYRGIVRGRIIAAPTDSPVLQGRLSINQAVNLLEGRRYVKHMGPAIQMVDSQSLRGLDLNQSMAPASFTPLFHYLP